MSTDTLAGSVAVVTGASSGIGAAVAVTLARHGATVALLARRADRLEDVAAIIRGAGGQALTLPAAVTDALSVDTAINHVADALGRLDILVNNAGLMRMGPAAEAPLAEWDALVSVNILGTLYITRSALPHLITAAADSARGVADIVTISSTAGRVARPGTAVYSLTKFGINAFSEGIRQEVLGKRVRVGIVAPGTVDTEISDGLRPEYRDAFDRQTAEMVKLEPEDVAEAVTYMVTRNRRVAVNDILIRAAEQSW